MSYAWIVVIVLAVLAVVSKERLTHMVLLPSSNVHMLWNSHSLLHYSLCCSSPFRLLPCSIWWSPPSSILWSTLLGASWLIKHWGGSSHKETDTLDLQRRVLIFSFGSADVSPEKSSKNVWKSISLSILLFPSNLSMVPLKVRQVWQFLSVRLNFFILNSIIYLSNRSWIFYIKNKHK